MMVSFSPRLQTTGRRLRRSLRVNGPLFSRMWISASPTAQRGCFQQTRTTPPGLPGCSSSMQRYDSVPSTTPTSAPPSGSFPKVTTNLLCRRLSPSSTIRFVRSRIGSCSCCPTLQCRCRHPRVERRRRRAVRMQLNPFWEMQIRCRRG